MLCCAVLRCVTLCLCVCSGPDGDRALMMMVYDVVNEEDIQEDDQIGSTK